MPALVKQLRTAVNEPHRGVLHFGATSQDVIDTSLTLRLKDVTNIFLGRLDRLIDAMAALKSRDGGIELMAHTRMQQALPFKAGDKLDTWIDPLKRHRRVFARVGRAPACHSTRRPGWHARRIRRQGRRACGNLGETARSSGPPSWHSQRDRIGEFGAFLSLVSGTLGKIGQDIALMAQNEIGAVRLPSGGGSSAMAHKSNPVAAEVLVALAASMRASSVRCIRRSCMRTNAPALPGRSNGWYSRK